MLNVPDGELKLPLAPPPLICLNDGATNGPVDVHAQLVTGAETVTVTEGNAEDAVDNPPGSKTEPTL